MHSAFTQTVRVVNLLVCGGEWREIGERTWIDSGIEIQYGRIASASVNAWID